MKYLPSRNNPLLVSLSALLCLAISMGIGRFALTPEIVLMIKDKQTSLSGASIIAAFNFVGYLCGAVDAMVSKKSLERKLFLGLFGCVFITVISYFMGSTVTHSICRFLIGWASGLTAVITMVWSNEYLLSTKKTNLNILVYSGTGFGIILSGLLFVYVISFNISASTSWLIYGMASLIMLIIILPCLPRNGELTETRKNIDRKNEKQSSSKAKLYLLIITYGLAGFSYIIPATFISHMVSIKFPNSILSHYTWPLFGLSINIGVFTILFVKNKLKTQSKLTMTLWLQAIGVIIILDTSNLSLFSFGVFLIGFGVMAIVQLAVQRGIEIDPGRNIYITGVLTVAYAIGQTIGPITSYVSSKLTGSINSSLMISIVALVIAGLLSLDFKHQDIDG